MSAPPDLTKYRIADPDVARLIGAGQGPQALAVAHRNLLEVQRRGSAGGGAVSVRTQGAAAMSDLACALLRCGQAEPAKKALDEALRLAPASVFAFHNMTALLLQHGQLKGPNLQVIISHLLRLDGSAEWTDAYRPVTWLPTFLNLEFVKGKCNLKCRMCIGTNAPGHPDRLSYMTPQDFRRALEAAPTIRAVTLSSGNSDPLLHPKLDEIIDAAREHGVLLDIFTNGLPLGERTCRRIVESSAVGMINFSIDAATAETYRRIRGGNFERLHRNLRMLGDMKSQSGRELPLLSLSFVAMADNIEELPAFVEMGVTHGARRVFVEDLLGWLSDHGGNRPATDNPRCHEYVREARRLADEAGLSLQLPERLRNLEPRAARASSPGTPAEPGALDVLETAQFTEKEPQRGSYRCCSWLNGVWVDEDGTLQPCCMVHGAADMGSTADGPLHANSKYNRVKSLLDEGKVFRQCAGKTMCGYVQQQKAQGRDLRFITREDLGELDRSSPRDARVSLPILADRR